MLVLTRRIGQSIVISDRITVTVNRIAGSRVALAFDAPGHAGIWRTELAVLGDEVDAKRNGRHAGSSGVVDQTGRGPA